MTELLEPQLADVETLVEEVWASFLGADQPLVPVRDLSAASAWWSATVTVTGAWQGMVTLELPEEAATAVTCTLLDLSDVTEVSEPDIADAVGELVNMVGGNIKSLMPDPSTLGLPVVSVGRLSPRADAVEVLRHETAWAGLPVRVRVHVNPTREVDQP